MKRIFNLVICFMLLASTAAWGTVNSSTATISYSCNGSTTIYTYPFQVLEDDDILAIKKASDGTETTLTLNSNYTVTGAGNDAGGTVVLTTGSVCGSGYTLKIMRQMDLLQETDYVDGDAFSAESFEDALDKQTIILQELDERVDRSVAFPKTGTAITNEIDGVEYVNRATKAIGFNSYGNLALLTTATVTSTVITPYDSSENYASLNAAIAAIGAVPTTLMIIDADFPMTGAAVVPETLLLKLEYPGSIENNYALSGDGMSKLEAGNYQIFTGSVTPSGLRESNPKWFGATGDGTTDDATALNNSIQALTTGGRWYLPKGTYILGTIAEGTGNNAAYLVPKSGIIYEGDGDVSILKVKTGENVAHPGWNIFKTTTTLENAVFRNMKMDGNAANNLISSPDVYSHMFIGTQVGASNNLIDNVTFTGNPGNNTIALGSTDGPSYVNNIVQNCRFTEMGSGITGNYNTDHSTIYLVGDHNKIMNNYFDSTEHVVGATWEFHGDNNEASGNESVGYSVPYYIVKNSSEGYSALTFNLIHDNKFTDTYSAGGFLSTAESGSMGTLVEHDNIYDIGTGASAAGVTVVLYGPDAANSYLTYRKYHHNTIINNSSNALAFYIPSLTKNVDVNNNYIEGFGVGIQLPSGTGIDGTYANYGIDIKNNTFVGLDSIPIVAAGSARVKSLTVTGNTIKESTASPAVTAIQFDEDVDTGYIGGNHIDSTYATPVFVDNPDNWVIEQLDYRGALWQGDSSIHMKTFLVTSIPVAEVFEIGDHAVNVTKVAGQPKGWFATVAGGAVGGTRGNGTGYSLGEWVTWSSGTTAWECTTAGTTAGAPPSIVGKVVGDTVVDGTATWTMRSLTTATLVSEGNL